MKSTAIIIAELVIISGRPNQPDLQTVLGKYTNNILSKVESLKSGGRC